jgi:hypothetical protein
MGKEFRSVCTYLCPGKLKLQIRSSIIDWKYSEEKKFQVALHW